MQRNMLLYSFYHLFTSAYILSKVKKTVEEPEEKSEKVSLRDLSLFISLF